MRAVVVPEPHAEWVVREVPDPAPGPADLVVRVRASGICHNDLLSSQDRIPFPTASPAIPGHEVVGDVVAQGAAVGTDRVGTTVAVPWVQAGCGSCWYCATGAPVTGTTALLCAGAVTTGFSSPGGHAEYVRVSAEAAVDVPAGLAPELAAPILCVGYTALSALRAAEPAPGERVAVVGIGGLGHLAVQFAAADGHETVAVTRGEAKADAARALGADVVVTSGAGLGEAGGADVVIVTSPSHPAASAALAGLRPGGRMVLAGMDVDEPFSIPPIMTMPFFALGQKIVGATHAGPDVLREALAYAGRGDVAPVVETYTLDEVDQAYARVAKGDARFRAVLVPGGRS